MTTSCHNHHITHALKYCNRALHIAALIFHQFRIVIAIVGVVGVVAVFCVVLLILHSLIDITDLA